MYFPDCLPYPHSTTSANRLMISHPCWNKREWFEALMLFRFGNHFFLFSFTGTHKVALRMKVLIAEFVVVIGILAFAYGESKKANFTREEIDAGLRKAETTAGKIARFIKN